MPTAVTNNKANVSTTRAIRGGYLFSAPIGTSGAPTKATFKTWTAGAGWDQLGYISADGFTESVDLANGDNITDINLDVIDQMDGSPTETIRMALMEIKESTLGTIYGHENVSDASGTIEVKHNWGNAGEHRQYVLLLELKNGRRWTKYVPDGKVTEIGDLTGNKTTVAQREVTLTYNTDEDGNGCFDWIDSTETS